MASRKDVVGRARGRKPAPVKKPFPTGMVLGYGSLFVVLGLIITYSAMNVGIGDKTSVAYVCKQIDGIDCDKGLDSNHIDGKNIDYPDKADTPPMGGNHNSQPQSCQVYTTPIASEHAVHSMEHGAVWITYDPEKASKDDIAALKKEADGNPYRLMSPYPGLKTPISLQAWGERLFVQKASDKRVKEFLDLLTQGPQAPEPNGTCVGSTDDRTKATATFSGTAPAKGKAGTPAPSATATVAPSASASPAATPTSATPAPSATK
jgi:hypothetical protein